MLDPAAYLLVSHGSRDPRPQFAIEALAHLVSQRLPVQPISSAARSASGSAFPCQPLVPFVGTATLELAALPLHQQIQQFANRTIAAGCQTLKILPLFLLPGVHVMEDIPQEMATVQQSLSNSIALDLRPHLGSHPQLKDLLNNELAPSAPRILLSHGSRRAGGNEPVETIAAQIGAVAAYWSVPPHLEAQVAALVKTGCREIVILPYFLFAGGITDAIVQTVADLAARFPTVQIHLADPLGASPTMAELAVDLMC